MKAALAHINSDGTIWLTRVETIAPDFNTFELLRLSVSDLRTLMQSQGYYEVYRFNARPALHVFVHDGLDEIDLTNAILTRPGESLVDTVKHERARDTAMRRVADAHEVLCEEERDHHAIEHCRCAIALRYRALRI